MKNPCLVIIDVQEKLFPVMSEIGKRILFKEPGCINKRVPVV